MTNTPKFHDPAFIALNKKKIKALESRFPMDRCRDLVRLTLAEQQAKVAPLGTEGLLNIDLDDPEIPEEFRGELKRLASLPPPTPEQEAQRFEQKALAAARTIVATWVNALYHSRRRSGNKPVRLDGSLLPPPELTKHGSKSWEESLTHSLALTAERIRALMARYAESLIPVFGAMFANQPNGFVLAEDIIICQDADGFYILPKSKE